MSERTTPTAPRAKRVPPVRRAVIKPPRVQLPPRRMPAHGGRRHA